MKIFLFLYPIKSFFDFTARRYSKIFEDKETNPEKINEIINVRYRQNGYTVYWILPGKEENVLEPGLDLFSDCLKKREGDVLISSGIPRSVIRKEGKPPDYEFILSQMRDVKEVVIGGFHQWKCVDDLARYFYNKDIPVTVDEDTTDAFFETTSRCGEIPLTREVFTRSCLGIRDVELGLERYLRNKKPWFAQI